jgi:hypothetical protein
LRPALLAFIAGSFLWSAIPSAAQEPPILLKAENRQPRGWGRDGWGSYRLTITNQSSVSATLVRWTAHWEAAGKPVGDSWGGDINQALPAGGTVVRDEVGVLPASVIEAARPGVPLMVGSVTVAWDGRQVDLPFRFEVPEAVLPGPLRLMKGRTVGIELMASRYGQFRTARRALGWIDQAYQAMIDLTGQHPFGGKLMVFKESPPHPWWAYAGQEMILNTDYVGQTLKDFDAGILPFGWVHEVGHNFDVLGDWYIWSGPAAESQANFKLCYAVETIPDQSFRMKWRPGPPTYAPHAVDQLLTGRQMVEGFFLPFGDEYLGDPARTWDSLNSDDITSFLLRIQQVYGWDPFKRWYRTYARLAAEGKKPPDKPEEKVNLLCAILSAEAGQNLVPAFQLWRFPVTNSSVKAIRTRYGLPG